MKQSDLIPYTQVIDLVNTSKVKIYFHLKKLNIDTNKKFKKIKISYLVPLHFSKIDLKNFLTKKINLAEKKLKISKINSQIIEIKKGSNSHRNKKLKKIRVTYIYNIDFYNKNKTFSLKTNLNN
jgi:hypothetical protein